MDEDLVKSKLFVSQRSYTVAHTWSNHHHKAEQAINRRKHIHHSGDCDLHDPESICFMLDQAEQSQACCPCCWLTPDRSLCYISSSCWETSVQRADFWSSTCRSVFCYATRLSPFYPNINASLGEGYVLKLHFLRVLLPLPLQRTAWTSRSWTLELGHEAARRFSCRCPRSSRTWSLRWKTSTRGITAVANSTGITSCPTALWVSRDSRKRRVSAATKSQPSQPHGDNYRDKCCFFMQTLYSLNFIFLVLFLTSP